MQADIHLKNMSANVTVAYGPGCLDSKVLACRLWKSNLSAVAVAQVVEAMLDCDEVELSSQPSLSDAKQAGL